MDNGVRTPAAADADATSMTTGAERASGPRPNGVRVAVKKEATSASASTTASAAASAVSAASVDDASVSRSLSPDDVARPSPNDSVSTPDTASAGPKTGGRRAPSAHKTSGTATPAVPVPRVLFDGVPDSTAEATAQFQVISDCLYGSKNMGSSDNDAFDCDCSEEWHDGRNLACGEDSDCINRATKMECVEAECNCGEGCQNQRFQRKQYARVSVIKTEKKGYGLRADADLHANDFIYEYIGEVINEPTFRRRMLQYDEEGIRHFYFMSLTKNEFVDATRKGNLGRFCNHSCAPNCYVDKWVVGKKLRMGIFAARRIRAGEELVFDYNVDRYGADPQPCYCGEPNCTGFIGGKTQTERATKLSQATIEALGIDDPDGWDTAVARRPRRKRPTEDDEDYVASLPPPAGLAEDGVTKVMAALMQCKEKWIAVKLLARIQAARDDERVLNRVVRMHGYQILCTVLTLFRDDDNLVLPLLDILYRLPRLTKNKISDAHIENVVESLAAAPDDRPAVAAQARRLLDAWSQLQIAYRIPRKKVDPNATASVSASAAVSAFEDRRGRDVQDDDGAAADADTPLSPLHGMVVPKGPRSSMPHHAHHAYNANNASINGNSAARGPRKPKNGGLPGGPLPNGWFAATDPNGKPYYYTQSGATTWKRPTQPADRVVPPLPRVPSKAQQDRNAVQEIINNLTRELPKPAASQTPMPATATTTIATATAPAPEPKKERWRSLPIEKQQKLYENTLYPHIKSITDRYRHRLPKEEIKKFGKELSKKLVASDYKNNRVQDPCAISAKQEKKVKDFVRKFFERAAIKYQEKEKRKAGGDAQHVAHGHGHGRSHGHGQQGTDVRETDGAPPAAGSAHRHGAGAGRDDELAVLDDMALSDDDGGEPMMMSPASPVSPDRKRKRADSGSGQDDTVATAAASTAASTAAAVTTASPSVTPSETPSVKRLRDEDSAVTAADSPSLSSTSTPPPPPPPPPPAPAEDDHMDPGQPTARQASDAAQRQREADEEALRRENEDAMRAFEQQSRQPPQPPVEVATNGA